jgi:hypothetical protein
MDVFGFTGYSLDISLGMNNLAEFASYVSGLYLVCDNLLIIGIFAEIAIIDLLLHRKKKKPEAPKNHSILTRARIFFVSSIRSILVSVTSLSKSSRGMAESTAFTSSLL